MGRLGVINYHTTEKSLRLCRRKQEKRYGNRLQILHADLRERDYDYDEYVYLTQSVADSGNDIQIEDNSKNVCETAFRTVLYYREEISIEISSR